MIVLRFAENKSLREVGSAMGASEDAAKMRVNRALEKLRKIFSKHGVTLGTVVIAGAVFGEFSAKAAPAGVAISMVAVAAKGTVASVTIATLVKGTMKTMTWLKIKFAVGGRCGSVARRWRGLRWQFLDKRVAAAMDLTVTAIARRQSQAAYAALTSYSDTAKGMSEGGGQITEVTCNIRLQRPKQYHVEWTSTGGLYTAKGVIWSEMGRRKL